MKIAISHGDDLGYIFDRNTLTGDRVAQNLDQEDEQVVDTFTDMVAQFARSGNYNMKDKSKQETDTYFSETANNYISIEQKPKKLNDFRYQFKFIDYYFFKLLNKKIKRQFWISGIAKWDFGWEWLSVYNQRHATFYELL